MIIDVSSGCMYCQYGTMIHEKKISSIFTKPTPLTDLILISMAANRIPPPPVGYVTVIEYSTSYRREIYDQLPGPRLDQMDSFLIMVMIVAQNPWRTTLVLGLAARWS